jgi:signal transduction histidine kinase/FixJ family two-component response regulator/CHASE3 domain sensor protein
MSKFRVEIQITLLTIIIAVVVGVIGYFSYKSLSEIVKSIEQGIHPNRQLSAIKDISAELTSYEQAVRIYGLTGNKDDLEASYLLEEKIAQEFKKLRESNKGDNYDKALTDSLSTLAQSKIDLWHEILNEQLSSKNNFPAYTEIYTKADKAKQDTTKSKIAKNENFQTKVTGDTLKTDSVQNTANSEMKSVRRKLLTLEWELYKNKKKKNVRESKLIERNILISEKIAGLIKEAENKDANLLLEKTKEIDRLAEITYERLALYSVSAVFLLLAALFVLFNYLRKTRSIQRTLTRAREDAESLALAKEQFAANVSHELRTPLNAIYGLTEQVLQKKLDKDTTEMVSAIFKSADHLKNIVNDTLDFSKIQANKLVLDSVNFSPAEIFEEVMYLVKHEAENKKIAFYFEWLGEKPETLVGDPLRLKQIMINLLGNAIKFTEKGEVAVKVNCGKTRDNFFEIEIRISDTGIGIGENDLRFVFDEYVKIENKTGKKYGGTGLGLAIVKKLVELQGGKISLESKPGNGTTVTVNLSFAEGEKHEAEEQANALFDIPGFLKQSTVLIADDEEYNRFLIKSILNKWGIGFKEVETGSEVINAALKGSFDLILMDLNMPEINGIEATKTILKKIPDAKIVAVTAANDELDKKQCFKAGMVGYLVKPFSEKDLFTVFSTVISEKINTGKTENADSRVNFSELKRLSGGDEKFMTEMIGLFIKSMETGITGIEDGLRSKNLNDIFEKAHKMAAPLKHIGAGGLYEKIKLLEKQAQQNASLKIITSDFKVLKNELQEVIVILKSHLEKTNL